MSERAARAQLAEVQEQLAGLIAERDKLAGKVQARNDELATQRAVNQQLMLKKEEVEWQLMAAIAKVRLREERAKDTEKAGVVLGSEERGQQDNEDSRAVCDVSSSSSLKQ
jgi:hypothetical protein